MKKYKFLIVICILLFGMHAFADFTIVVLGDTQYLTESENGGEILKRMTRFIPDRKEELNIVFVASNGDMTKNKDVDAEWSRIRAAYDVLYPAAGIPYAHSLGNHDAPASINKWFPVSEFENRPYWGGHFNGIENAYYLFNAD